MIPSRKETVPLLEDLNFSLRISQAEQEMDTFHCKYSLISNLRSAHRAISSRTSRLVCILTKLEPVSKTFEDKMHHRLFAEKEILWGRLLVTLVRKYLTEQFIEVKVLL